jgi:glutamate 5-kinase
VAVIANGTRADTLARVFAGDEVGTAFIPTSRMAGKRRWIAYAASVRGRVVVNIGAREAILRGKASLLSSGVVRIEREFEQLDVVSIVDPDGREFARGIANCASSETERSINSSDEGSERERKGSVLVTRDNIVILDDRVEELLPENSEIQNQESLVP